MFQFFYVLNIKNFSLLEYCHNLNSIIKEEPIHIIWALKEKFSSLNYLRYIIKYIQSISCFIQIRQGVIVPLKGTPVSEHTHLKNQQNKHSKHCGKLTMH